MYLKTITALFFVPGLVSNQTAVYRPEIAPPILLYFFHFKFLL